MLDVDIERFSQRQDYKVLVRCFTYNQAEYITDTLNGFAIQQTDFPFVCIVMDDCSTDGEQSIINSYLSDNFYMEKSEKYETDYASIIIANHKTNNNCTIAVYFLKYNHYSKKKMKGSYLSKWREHCIYEALCEGDDYWTDPLKLQKQVAFLEAHSEMVCCYTNYGTVDKNNQMIEWPNHNKNISRSFTGDNFRELINGMYMQTLTILYRKDVLESLDYQGGIDYSLALACALMGKCSYLKDVTANYRLHNASATHTAMDYVRTASLKAWEYYVELYLSKTQYRRPLWEHLLICGTIDACLISKKRYGGVNAEQADRVLKHHPELKKYMWLGVLYRLRHIIVKRFK